MKIFWMAAIVALLCLPVLAQDDPNSAVVSRVIALEKAWNQAFKFRDVKAIDTLLDDSMVLVNDDGSLQTKGVFLASVRESKASDEQQVTPESISVHVYGSIAIATGVFRTKGVESGKPYVRRDRFVDVWMNKGGSWVCVSASAIPVLH